MVAVPPRFTLPARLAFEPLHLPVTVRVMADIFQTHAALAPRFLLHITRDSTELPVAMEQGEDPWATVVIDRPGLYQAELTFDGQTTNAFGWLEVAEVPCPGGTRRLEAVSHFGPRFTNGRVVIGGWERLDQPEPGLIEWRREGALVSSSTWTPGEADNFWFELEGAISEKGAPGARIGDRCGVRFIDESLKPPVALGPGEWTVRVARSGLEAVEVAFRVMTNGSVAGCGSCSVPCCSRLGYCG